ncbi:MAG TPA: hypothetical protein VGQ13_04035 [Nitrososphaera sp.]|jgi:hypothetical protein|nr:hypothetical protein [Nitrososphaera sp.]
MDNKGYYKALPILDTLVDYVTLDPATRKRIYEMTEEEKKKSTHHFIVLPKALVEDFRKLYHGPRSDGNPPLRYLSPGKQIDPAKGIVTVRRPVNFLEAWGRYDPEYIVLQGGFYYVETRYQATQMGMMPFEVKTPMIDFSDPNLKYHETDTVPFSYRTESYDKGWSEISPVCTMIEKIIAEALENAGYNIEQPATTTTEIEPLPGQDIDKDDDEPSLLDKFKKRLKL